MNAKIEVSFDPTNVVHVESLNLFLMAIATEGMEKTPKLSDVHRADLTGAGASDTVAEVIEKKAKNIFKEKNKAAKAKVEEVEEVEEEAEDTVTIEEIRKLVSEKAKENRKAVKDKLTEFEADNVTSLDKAHYVDFYNFLMEL